MSRTLAIAMRLLRLMFRRCPHVLVDILLLSSIFTFVLEIGQACTEARVRVLFCQLLFLSAN